MFPRVDLKELDFCIPEYELRHLWCLRGNCFSNLYGDSSARIQRIPHIHLSDLEFWIQIKSSVCERSLLFAHRGVVHRGVDEGGFFLTPANVEQFVCLVCCENRSGFPRYPAHIHMNAFALKSSASHHHHHDHDHHHHHDQHQRCPPLETVREREEEGEESRESAKRKYF